MERSHDNPRARTVLHPYTTIMHPIQLMTRTFKVSAASTLIKLVAMLTTTTTEQQLSDLLIAAQGLNAVPGYGKSTAIARLVNERSESSP